MKTNIAAGLAGGAAIVGLLLGLAMGGSGDELEEIAGRQDELGQAVSQVSESLAALEGRFDEIGTRIDAVGESVTGQENSFTALSDRLGEMGETVSGLGDSVGQRVSDVGSDISSGFSEQVARLEERIAALRSVGSGTGDGGGAAEATGAAESAVSGSEETGSEGDGPQAGERLLPGASLALGEGAGRLFLSGVDEEAGTARVALNGTEVSTLSLDEPVEAGACQVMLTGIEPPAALIDATCGGESANSGEASSGGGGSAEAPGLGEGTEIGIGETAAFGDNLRVFLSRLDPDGGSASIAVNGPDPADLAMGESMEAGGCELTLTGMTESAASLSASC